MVALVGVLGTASLSAADDSLHHAGLVIRHGDGRLTYAYVGFAEEEIDGIELLRRSGVEQVTIPFGGLGEGVCQIAGEGCSAGECRRRLCQAPGEASPYWRYFGIDEFGAWAPFALGPSSTTVRDGTVHGWSWTAAEPGLPVVTLADVAALAGAPPAGTEATASGSVVSVRTVLPPGVEPPTEDESPEPLTYAVAIGALLVIGGAASLAVRRGRTQRGRAKEIAA